MATGYSSQNWTPSQQIINNNFPDLFDNVDLNSLYPCLVKYGMLTEDLKQQFLLPTVTDISKKRLIWTALSNSRHPNNLKNLIECLQKSADSDNLDEHRRIAQKLTNDLNNNIGVKTGIRQDWQIHGEDPQQDTDVIVGGPMPENEEEEPPKDEEEGEDEDEDETEGLLPAAHAGGGGSPPNGEAEAVHVAAKWFNKRLCKWCCYIALISYPIAVILCLLCFIPAGIVTWNHTKDLPTTYSVAVSDNQTVVWPLQPIINERFTHSFSLQLEDPSPNCQGGTSCDCESQSVLIPCSNLSKSYKTDITSSSGYFGSFKGQFYLLNGSTIRISYKTLGHSNPASIWVFGNTTKAYDSFSDHPQCSDPKYKDYGKCVTLTEDETIMFPISSNNFYFIRCFQEKGGTCLNLNQISWSIDLYWYNFSQYDDSKRTDVTRLNVTSYPKTTVTLRNVFDPSHYGTDLNMCLLIRKHKTTSTDCEPTVDAVLTDVTRVKDAWLFTAIVAFVIAIVFGILAIVVHVGCLVFLAKKKLQLDPAPV